MNNMGQPGPAETSGESAALPKSRFFRQESLVPFTKLNEPKEITVTVVGVGAVGRQLALQLAAMGIPRLRLIDFDKVEPSNVTTQMYPHADIGKSKVESCMASVLATDPNIKVEIVDDRYRPKFNSEVMFCCVDNMDIRKTIWERGGNVALFYADGRMRGETVRVLSVTSDPKLDPKSEDAMFNKSLADYYPTQLFEQAQAETGRCTEPGVVYGAAVTASYMAHQFARWLRSVQVEKDFLFNMSSGDISFDASDKNAGFASSSTPTEPVLGATAG